MAVQFTRNGRRAMLWAQVEAMRRGDVLVRCEHMLLGLLHGEKTGALQLIADLGFAVEEVREAVSKSLSPEAAAPLVQSSQLAPDSRTVVDQARRETERTGDDYVGTEHILIAILRANAATDAANALVPSLLPFMQRGMTYEAASAAAESLTDEGTRDDARAAVPARMTPAPPAKIPARPGFLKGRHFLSVDDLSSQEIRTLFELTREIKTGRTPANGKNKTLGLIFEKPSLRTHVSFSVAMTRLGGNVVYLGREDIGLGTREPIGDVAKVLSRMVDVVAIRAFQDDHVRTFAAHADIPVINALTDREHPCQALADFYTILEYRSETAGMKLVFVGDGNNVAQSLMLLAPRLGTHFTLACPPGYEPSPASIEQAQMLAKAHGTRFEITHNALAAADDADILYTDVWTSMGQEDENERRSHEFAAYQINDELIREAKDDVLVLHCLPAHRGQEITESVMDSPLCAVFDQAENRLHVQQALLAAVL